MIGLANTRISTTGYAQKSPRLLHLTMDGVWSPLVHSRSKCTHVGKVEVNNFGT